MGSLHRSHPLCSHSATWICHCQRFELSPPAEESVISIALKNIGVLPLPLNLPDVADQSSSRGTQLPPLKSMLCSLGSGPDRAHLSLRLPKPSLREAPVSPTPSLSPPRLTFSLGRFASLSLSLFICKVGVMARPTSTNGCYGDKVWSGAAAWRLPAVSRERSRRRIFSAPLPITASFPGCPRAEHVLEGAGLAGTL